MKTKRLLVLLLMLYLVVGLLLPVQGHAATVNSGTCGDNLTWTLDDAGTLTISGTGQMKDFENSSFAPWSSYRTTIKKVVISDGVTSISKHAFYQYTSLTSVEIGNGVTSIGEDAFNRCTNLISVEIGDSLTSIGENAFDYCTSLGAFKVSNHNASYSNDSFGVLFNKNKTEVIQAPGTISGHYSIPDSVTNIGYRAFYDCYRLTSVEIPDSVTSIGNFAFTYCSGLPDITIPDSVTSIGNSAFYGCRKLTSITIPNSVTSIGNSAFSDCTSLTSVEIGNGVTRIGSFAFSGCTSLTSITIPDSVTSIGKDAFSSTAWFESQPNGMVYAGKVAYTFKGGYPQTITLEPGTVGIADNAFYRCTYLTSITIPDSVTCIGDYAFYYCDRLTSATIGNSVTSIGDYAFSNCGRLNDITIPDSVTSIGDYAFRYCGGPRNITIPDSATSIGEGAFSNCGHLNSVEIGGDMTSIGDYAFSDCTGLTSVTIGNGVTSIGDYVFSDCTRLTSVTIGNGVTSIGDYAFSNCSRLPDITIPDSVTSIGASAFSDCTSLTLVEIGDRLTGIGEGAFYGCTSLCAFEVSNHNANYSNDSCGVLFNKNKTEIILVPGAISGHYAIPDGVTSIRARAFYGCTKLTSVTIPDSMTHISESAFAGFTGLTSITIPDSVNSIGASAFSGCTGLTSVEIGDSVTSIGASAFAGCTGMTSITVPDNVTSISDAAFTGCSSLKSITIPFLGNRKAASGDYPYPFGCIFGTQSYEGGEATRQQHMTSSNSGTTSATYYIPTSLKYVTVTGGEILNGAFSNCRNLISVTLPDSATIIDYYVFYNCTSLTSITIPDSVTTINHSAFDNCVGLTSITIPDGVTDIDAGVFSNCTSLTSITIPNSVTYIGSSAFERCNQLSDVYYAGTESQWNSITIIQDDAHIHESNNSPLINAKKHFNHVHDYTQIPSTTVQPTCTEAGYTVYTCVQGETYQEKIAALGHDWTAATCTTPETCSTCGKTNGRAWGHSWKDATCIAPKTCSVCGTTEGEASSVHTYRGGICIHCDAIELVTLITMRMQLKNELQADFAFLKQKLPYISGYYAVVTQQLEDGTRTTTIPSSAWYTEGGYVVVPYTNMAAKEMTDALTIVLYNADGQAISYRYTSTLAEYAVRAFDLAANKGDTEAMDMYVSMLYYGAAAQEAFNYKKTNKATDYLTDAMAAFSRTKADLNKAETTGSGATGGLSGSRAILESNIQLQMGFDPSLYDSGYTATYSYVNHEGKTVEGSLPIEIMPDGSRSVITMNELVIADCGQLVTIRIYNAKGERVIKVFDSVENFAIRMSASTTAKEAQKVLAQEIMNFSTSAYNYFH